MKNICLWCGEWRPSSPPNRRFCSRQCCSNFTALKSYYGHFKIKKHFNLFLNIVNASETPDEFLSLYKQYFGDDKKAEAASS